VTTCRPRLSRRKSLQRKQFRTFTKLIELTLLQVRSKSNSTCWVNRQLTHLHVHGAPVGERTACADQRGGRDTPHRPVFVRPAEVDGLKAVASFSPENLRPE
jgi:hypothetical protein